MTQNEEILKALRNGDILTSIDALNQFGCFRLAARVKDLRDEGHNVKTIMRERNGKRYAAYYM